MSSLLRKIIRRPPGSSITSKPRLYKFSAWVNIFCQLLLPVSSAFTPAIAALTSSKNDASFSSVATQPYILAANENVQTVADRLGLTLAQLKRVNQYRIFARGFEQVRPGDEIDIPLHQPTAPSTPALAHATPGLTSPVAKDAPQANAPSPSAQSYDAAAGMVRSMATSKATQEVQKWLSQYGTARVQLNVDPHFSLEGSALDWLLPFYDTPSLTLFSQLGARNKDQRNTVNIGVGARTLHNNWLLGANTFYDYDLTGNNSRLGMGWRPGPIICSWHSMVTCVLITGISRVTSLIIMSAPPMASIFAPMAGYRPCRSWEANWSTRNTSARMWRCSARITCSITRTP
ncbi:Invasin [Edwardsiella tarda]|nr:Invasin [Edwardsiella tarda]